MSLPSSISSEADLQPRFFGAIGPATPPRVGSRATWLAVGALLAIHATLAWLARDPGIATGQDDAVYVLLGRSLQSLEYRELFRIDAPIHSMYPPGYPAALAIWEALGGQRFDWLVTLSIAASAATLGLAYLIVARLAGPAIALVSLGAMSVNPHLVAHAGSLASEPLFAFYSVLALWAVIRQDMTRRGVVLAAAAAIAAALTRSIGVALLAAIGVHWLLQRRYARVAWFALACALTVGAWLAWTALAPEQIPGRSYVADATTLGVNQTFTEEFVGRAALKVPRYLALNLTTLMPFPLIRGTIVDNIAAVIVIGVGLIVGLVVLWRRCRVPALYLIIYAAILAIWPWRSGRFLLPVLPLIVPLVVVGVAVAARRVHRLGGSVAVGTLALALTLEGATSTRQRIWAVSACDRSGTLPSAPCLQPDQRSFFAAIDYVNRRTSPAAVFLTLKPAPLYYYTGRPTVPRETALAQDASVFVDYLRRFGAPYVLLGRLHVREPRRLAGLMWSNCQAFSREAVFPPRTYLFRLRETPLPRGEGDACAAIDEYQRLVAADPLPR